MNALSEFLSTNSPKEQSAEETILTICDRLSNATLVSDRRGAVLSLKAFSRQYRESVVAHGLRGLINTLNESKDDLEITKSILKTLLILFVKTDASVDNDDDLAFAIDFRDRNLRINQDESQSISSLDQISLFVADEIISTSDSIETLISSLSSTSDFYMKLYILQIIELLVSTRPVRTKEILLGSPLSLPVIIACLDDIHEPIRNETILLLTRLSIDNFNIQKLVAFENIFDKLFEIIDAEGAIRGSLVVKDCLDFLIELVRYNASNQKLFLETQGIPKLANLVLQPLSEPDFFWNDQRVENLTRCVQLVRVFVEEGSKTAQKILADNRLTLLMLQLAFTVSTPNQIKKEALLTVADIIRSNAELQLSFSQIDVPYIDPATPNLKVSSTPIPIISALLNWILFSNSIHTFDIRVAAKNVLEAYFEDNNDAKIAFMEDQIADYKGESDEHDETDSKIPHANIFATLLDYDPDCRLNPYKSWFCCVILVFLLKDNPPLGELFGSLSTGEASAGEEVFTATQALQEQLVSSLELSDPRVAMGYLMLLISWLFLNRKSCNDFLKEYSHIISLISFISQPKSVVEFSLVDSMIVVLLGVVYDSTTADSVISRQDLYALILKMINEENYLLKIKAFKDSKVVSSIEDNNLFNYKKDLATGLPQVYLTYEFKEFFLQIFPRIKKLKSYLIQPKEEISYEVLEELEANEFSLRQELEVANGAITSHLERLKIFEEENSTLKQTCDATNEKLEAANSAETKLHAELKALQEEFSTLSESQKQLEATSAKYFEDWQASSKDVTSFELKNNELQAQLGQLREAKQKAEDGINKMSRELFQLTREKDSIEKQVKNLQSEAAATAKKHQNVINDFNKQLKAKDDKIAALTKKESELTANFSELKESQKALTSQVTDLTKKLDEAQAINSQYLEKFRLSSKVIDEFKNEKSDLSQKLQELTMKTNKETYGLKANLDTLKTKLDELTTQNNNLKAQVDQVNAEKSKAEEKLKAFETESQTTSASLSAELEKAKEELLSFSEVKRELEARHSLLDEKHDILAKSHNELQDSHAAKVDEFTKVQQALNDKELELSKIGDLKGALEKELASLKDEVESKLNDKNEAVQRLETFEKETNQEIDSLKEELEKKKSELVVKESELAKLREDLGSENSKISQTNDKLTNDLKELQTQMETDHRTLKAQIADLESNLASAEKEKDALVKELADSKEAFKVEKEDLSKDLTQETDKLNSKIEELNKLQKLYDIKMTEFQKEKESLIASHSKETDEHKALVENYNERITKLEVEVEKSKQKAEVVKEEKADYEEQIKQLQEANSVAESQQKKKFADLKEQKESILQEKNSLSSTLEMISQKMNESDQKFTESQIEKNNIAKELEGARDELKKMKSTFESEEIKLKGKISKLEADVVRIKDELTQKAKEVDLERANLTKSSESVVQSYIEKIRLLEEENSKSKEEIGNLSSQIKELEAKLSSNATASEEQQASIATLKANKEELEAALEAEVSQHKGVASKLASTEKELENIKKDLESKSKELELKGKELSELEKSTKSQTEKLNQELIIVKKQRSETENTGAKEVEQLKEQIEHLEAELKKERNSVQQSELKAQESVSANEELSKALKIEESKLLDKLDEFDKLERDFEKSKAEFTKLESEKQELELKFDKQRSESENISSDYKEANSKIKSLEASLKEKEDKLSSLSSELVTVRDNFEKVKADHEGITTSANAELSDLKSKQQGIEKDLEASKKELVDLEKEKTELSAKLESVTSEKSILETTVETLQEKAKKADEDNELQTSKVTAAETKIEELEKKLASMVPKSDLEDLIFLMNETSKQYKERLRALGENISSDEDDDEDDEDDEEE